MFNLMITDYKGVQTRVTVFGAAGERRLARFTTWEDACEAAFVIDMLRRDTAYRGCHVVSALD